MDRWEHTRSLFILCALFLANGVCAGNGDALGGGRSEPTVVMKVGSLRITNTVIELRCQVENNTGHDIWVCARTPEEIERDEGRAIPELDAYLSLDNDGPTLFVFGRMNQLWRHRGVFGHRYSVPYARLRAGQNQPKALSFRLPMTFDRAYRMGFVNALYGRMEYITRVVFEIGYYTAEDLDYLKRSVAGGYQALDFDTSGERVFVTDATEGELMNAERAARMTIDGVSIPYKQWLHYETGTSVPFVPPASLLLSLGRVVQEHPESFPPDEYRYARRLFMFDQSLFDEPTRQIANLYTELAAGKLNPAELTDRLDEILNKSDREKLLEKLRLKQKAASVPGPHLTSIQALEDLFYNSSIDLEQFRYAQELFRFDNEVLDEDETAQQIAATYTEVSKGKLNPTELNRCLDNIAGNVDRERLLQRLRERQSALTQRKQVRIAGLLAEAKSQDNPSKGRKALVLLREVLALDLCNGEAVDLMQKIGNYYRGEVIKNSAGMELAWVPPGKFLMGKQDVPAQHEVRISRGFWMGVREVTQAQYQAIMGADLSGSRGEALPASRMSWYDAMEFCRRLGEKEGRTYRLPTEAEWEYACRAGTSTDYWWGDDTKADPGTANAFGLYDMHGKVGEWCQDWVSITYHRWLETDPQGPPGPELQRERVVRACPKPGWGRDGKCPCYLRQSMAPELMDDFVGFRVVLEDN